MKRRALISVTDKTGVVEFAQGLIGLGYSILSTGGTLKALAEAGVAVEQVADYIGFPEVFGGRVKTLHPRIHGGILAPRGDDAAAAVMQEHGIDPIDVVAVNLYRFRETAARPGATTDEIVENIDIGGPSMIRSAAKNHAAVTVVVEPGEYGAVLAALQRGDQEELGALRRRLAGVAYAHTAAYDCAIASWFAGLPGGEPRFAALVGDKVQDLRYGENPHQSAAFYRSADAAAPNLAGARQLGGKELSYNNILDLDAALGLVREFPAPACVIVKHNNPCGTATAAELSRAFGAALDGDPVSAFGGIVAVNRNLDVATATAMVERGTFVEAILAPAVDADALAVLGEAKWGKNVRVLALGEGPGDVEGRRFRQVSGGFLVQDADVPTAAVPMETATARDPDAAEREALAFAWRVCKHVRSNAIVLARADDGVFATVGVGAGQMSRVDSVEIAVGKAAERAQGAVLASDAFFPFADGLEAAARAGVTAAIQPGGSRRDDEVIAAADAAGMAMVFTGRRHFRH